MSPLFDINPGTIFGALWVQQQEAERRRELDQFAADLRHQEMLDVLEDSYEPPLPPAQEDDSRNPPPEPSAPPYFGPRISVASLGLRDLVADPISASADALWAELDPPNVIVVGGTEDTGWAAAQDLQRLLGGQLRGVRLQGLREGDLAAELTSLGDGDVVYIPSFEDASEAIVGVLASSLVVCDREQNVSNDVGERDRLVAGGLSYEEAGQRVGFHVEVNHGRWLSVTIGKGSAARELVLALHMYVVVAQTPSGMLPASLTAWGGQIVAPRSTKTCPQCAEEVKAAAVICRFCRFEFVAAEPEPEHEPVAPDLPEPTDTVGGNWPPAEAAPVSVVHASARPGPEHRRAPLKALLQTRLDEGLRAIQREDASALILWVDATSALVGAAFGYAAASPFDALASQLRASGVHHIDPALASSWRSRLAALIDDADRLEIRDGFNPDRWWR